MINQKKVHNRSSPQEKIQLFRSLFRGREDVYPRRFENRKSGKSGYVFVCANEWVRGVCEKPRVKCSECLYRRTVSISDEIVQWHLTGHDARGKDFVMGIYPMLQDESCYFLVADFDKGSWEEDVKAFSLTCKQMHLHHAIERSRSGNGAHVWLFFEEAIQASLARKLGCHLLTKTMEHNVNIGLDSYDRLFPNQDTLPQGGFGNLIALPLQKKAREQGNSVFVDDQFIPYSDQWKFLSNLHKITKAEVEKIVQNADRKGKVLDVRLCFLDDDPDKPWTLSPSGNKPNQKFTDVPKEIQLVVGNQIYISKDELPSPICNRLIRMAAFQNPEFYKAQAMRFPTYDIPRIIGCAENFPKHIGLPRGCLEEAKSFFKDVGSKVTIKNEVFRGKKLEVEFQGSLRTEQQLAANSLVKHNLGVLSATTAFGKTVLASWLIAKRKVNTLILVHRKQLQDQWVERLSMFLDIPKNKIGKIGGGRKSPKGIIDVALIQSLVRKGVVDDIVANYGYVIVDECHHLPAQSFEQVIRQAKAKYITGLTATLKRKDGHHPIITMLCGPVRYVVSAKDQAKVRPFEHTVLVRPTSFVFVVPTNVNTKISFNQLYDEVQKDSSRNRMICEDVLNSLKRGRSPIILTERNEHLITLAEMLRPKVKNLIVLRGKMSRKDIDEANERLKSISDDEERLILASGKYVGEGFDDARLDTLFLTMPVSWQGTIAQYVGRLHRLHDHKKEVQVYDYADLNVSVLERMFNRRCKGYEAVGYNILIPASAVPGWPTEVPLPVDPLWKKDYAASIKRLVFDGVDVQLANLFVRASTVIPTEAKGVERARSHVEAFLFRRLESLEKTKGKFSLNALLSIPFDLSSRMEVDFLYQDARLVVEIDGSQHLGDPDAYRRDRRKDALLQRNGYLVLRFLAEDVTKNLDSVLDAILQVLPQNS